MKASFIISEFNLLHRGHLRLFSACREQVPDGAIVAVMSGSTVQRGELAVQSKYVRAEAAVRCGADLVLELPAPWSCSGAEFFAGAGTRLAASFAASCGAEGYLCFGSESGDTARLRSIAELLGRPEYLARLSDERTKKSDRSESDIRTRDRVLREMYGIALPTCANDILGVEYLRAIDRYSLGLTPITVRRGGDESATRTRAALLRRDIRELSHICPAEMTDLIGAVPDMSRLYPLIAEHFLYSPLPADEIDGLSADLYYRIRDKVLQCKDYEELISSVTTKKYTCARVRRVILHTILGADAGTLAASPGFTVVLAAGGRGKALLAERRRRGGELAVLTSSGGDADGVPGISLLRRADELWSLSVGEVPAALRKKHPYISDC